MGNQLVNPLFANLNDEIPEGFVKSSQQNQSAGTIVRMSERDLIEQVNDLRKLPKVTR